MATEPVERRRDLFIFVRTTMNYAAMYPIHLHLLFPRYLCGVGIFIEWAIELFLYLVPIHIVIMYVCTIYLNLHGGDLELLVNCMMQTIIYMWTIFMKIYFRRIRPRQLADMLESINSKYRTRSAIGFTYVTMNESLSMSNKYIKAYVYCCYIGTVFWLILPIVYGDRSLPLTCWYPMDIKEPVIYEVIYFLQSVGQIQVAAAYSASSGLYMMLAILLSGQYDILFCSLKNILATVAVRMRSTKNDLRKLLELQEFTEPELKEYYCAKEKTCTINVLLEYTSVYGNGRNDQQDFRLNFRNAFEKCIEHHKQILDGLKKMENIYCPIWFFKTGEFILLMCLVVFVSVKSTTANSSFMKVLSLGQYMMLIAWELLIICYFGEIIYINSQRCGEAILRSPWYLHIREIKNDILMFLVISYRPFKLTAGKISHLNVEYFRSVMMTAFSFLTLLQNMDQRN